jgi:cation diffusion facilitator CzcD-associated flavoprotein CzcO
MRTASPRVAIIGAGFAGLGMGCYLQRAGLQQFTIFEKGTDVGGVWRENTYPGAACDVPSHLYSFSFARHYDWSHKHAPQAEILSYLREVVRRHGLTGRIRFGREATTAVFDEDRHRWTLGFTDGSREEADVLITAVGQLHRPKYPEIPGRETFEGTAFHSASWDHGYDFTGRTVAVLGTGSSAVQIVPAIAGRVKRLHLFQRSPGWVVPRGDRPYRAWERRLLGRVPLLRDADRLRTFCLFELLNSALQGNRLGAALMRHHLAGVISAQVPDPDLRRLLTPDYPVGCKRVVVSDDWLPTLGQPHVEVVGDPIQEITATGLTTVDGRHREVEAIIYATGFTATEFLAPMRVSGAGGRWLDEVWRGGAEAYRGVAVAGFPNLFLLYGPNSNLGIGSIVYVLERQQRYVTECLRRLQERGATRIEVLPEAQRAFNEALQARSRRTAFEGGCTSWYRTADGRNTNNWAGLAVAYARALRRVRLADFNVSGPGA